MKGGTGMTFDQTHNPDAICSCGHTYINHFIERVQDEVAGCRYCACRTFVLVAPGELPASPFRSAVQQMVGLLMGSDTDLYLRYKGGGRLSSEEKARVASWGWDKEGEPPLATPPDIRAGATSAYADRPLP